MKIEFVTKDLAKKRYENLKDVAFSIAKENGTLPGYCSAPECIQFVAYAGLVTTLKGNEQAIFINDCPAEVITDFNIQGGNFIGKLIGENMIDASINEGLLTVKFVDGVREWYKWMDDVQCWIYEGKNTNIKLANRSIN